MRHVRLPTIKCASLAVVGFLGVAAVCGSAQAEDPVGSSNGPLPPFQGCRFYENRDYGGHHFDVRGNTNVSYIGSAWNDKISSLSCSYGCMATIFEHRDFGGARVNWGGAIDYVGSFWNDRVSSMKVACDSSSPEGPVIPAGDACRSGYVWREARRSDHVCVPPGARDRTQLENEQASSHVDPRGAWGPTSCITGFVWREAFDGDHVCVSPATRDWVREENRVGPSRRQ